MDIKTLIELLRQAALKRLLDYDVWNIDDDQIKEEMQSILIENSYGAIESD